AFLILDGVLPSNEGRGYVLRRIIRRAIRHGYKLGIAETFFYRLVEPLAAEMGGAYPELVSARVRVERVLRQEEERFKETLDQGMKILEQDIARLPGRVIPGATAFKLYDTYGFPVDLTADIARERDLAVDMEGFEREMNVQRERARAASQFGAEYSAVLEAEGCTDFTGYERLAGDAKVIALYRDGNPADSLQAGDRGTVILDRTPCYAESGGQVGDHGVIASADAEFEVQDTRKHGAGVHAHTGVLTRGRHAGGAKVQVKVDAARRRATMLNHSATHLLHAALRRVLGTHVTQKGSLVEPERLRFDFSHAEPMTWAELEQVERLVNDQIRANHEAQTRIMAYDQAIAAGAMALFGEKYGAEVRVLTIGEFSTELCGGTHVRRAGDIGLFKIVSETGVAAGVRRIEAVTGERAIEWIEENERRLQQMAELLRAGRDNLDEKLRQVLDKNRKLEKELEQLKARLTSSAGSDLASQAVDVGDMKVLAARIDGADAKALREAVDRLKQKLGSAAVVLATVADGKVSLVAGVTADCTTRIKAGDLVNAVAQQIGGKGGGRADMAQAGGNDPTALEAALRAVPDWVRARLG
ncbi:MAG: alanine--tRNA ligase, partial [Gammaproteobacteria bacterium]|nr:alanine--tRNA ligase [Gammaproteobacteria bacterium]